MATRYGDMIESLLPGLMRKLVADYEAKRHVKGFPMSDADIVIDRLTYTASMRRRKPVGRIEMNCSVMPFMGERSQDTIEATGEDLIERIVALFEQAGQQASFR